MADAELLSQACGSARCPRAHRAALGGGEGHRQRCGRRRGAEGVGRGRRRGCGDPVGGSVGGGRSRQRRPRLQKRRQTADGRRKPNQRLVETPAAAAVAVPAAVAVAAAAEERPRVIPVLEGRRESHWKLIFGVVGLLTLGLLGGWVLPALDTLDDPGAPAALTAAGAEGRRIYLREGCQSCHTQVVRPIVTDAGLGSGVERRIGWRVSRATPSARSATGLTSPTSGAVREWTWPRSRPISATPGRLAPRA